MLRKVNPRRYARAVYEIALETKALERWQSDLQKIAAVMRNADFLAVMESPRIKFEDKSRIMGQSLVEISPAAMNLARLLTVKNAINMIGEIAVEYQHLLDAYYGIRPAQVVTAVAIDAEDKEKLAENLGALVDSKIVVESRVDPEILGGVIARVGGKLLDGSTRSRLAELKRQLRGAGSKG
jgi:F-type H+-transporting ATPase subunit delta